MKEIIIESITMNYHGVLPDVGSIKDRLLSYYIDEDDNGAQVGILGEKYIIYIDLKKYSKVLNPQVSSNIIAVHQLVEKLKYLFAEYKRFPYFFLGKDKKQKIQHGYYYIEYDFKLGISN